MPKPKTETKPKPETTKELPSALVPFSQLADQYKLPLDQVRALIRSESLPTDSALMKAVEQARMLGVPLQGVNIIPNKNGIAIYINSDGIRWLLNTDPRKLKSVETKILQMPTTEGTMAVVEGAVEFENGARFTNIGAVVVEKNWNAANALMKAATKAKRRAGQDAVGTPLPVYEDYIEYREEQMKDITPATQSLGASNGNGEPTTLAAFLAKLSETKIDVDAACQTLQVAQITQVKDFGAAWAKLKPTMEL